MKKVKKQDATFKQREAHSNYILSNLAAKGIIKSLTSSSNDNSKLETLAIDYVDGTSNSM